MLAIRFGIRKLSTVTTSNGDLQQLNASGRDVVESRGQIAAIVGNRIGKSAARLFAEPSTRRSDGSVAWVDTGGEPLQSVASLPDGQASAVRDNYQLLKEQIESLANQMQHEGDAGRLAARIMRLAMVTPDGFDALHAVGNQPVLVNWGYATTEQSLPADIDATAPVSEVPAVALATTGAADIAKNQAAASSPAAGSPAAEPPLADDGDSGADRMPTEVLIWLLPLLLLAALGWLIWLLLQPLDPVVVDEELPPDAVIDPVPAALAGRDALLAKLDEATRLREGLSGICIAIPEPEPEPEPQPDPAPAVTDPLPDPPAIPEVVLKDPDPVPVPPAVVPRPERIELPPEVPKAEDTPVDLAQQPVRLRPEPTLCEPGWTPTQRPEVMVVIDGSGSMREGFPGASSRIDAAKGAVEGVVKNLHKDIRTGLVSFTDCDATSTPKKYRFSERPELLSRVRGVSPTRGTSLANSIRRAGNAAKSGGPATVVVVSDGEDTCGGDPCAAARKLKAQKPLLKVNVIDLSGGRSAVLQCVASVTGGRVFTPKNASQMNEEMQEATGQPKASQCNG